MRSILLATILAASTLVTNVRTADACGGGSYEWHPTAHAIATPSGSSERGASFALMWERLDQKSGANVKLARLDTKSYDHSTSAFNRRLPDATRLTLLGPSGTKLFEASSTVWLDLAFDKEGAREAVELPKGQFVVALAGHFKDATWTDFQVIHGSTITSFTADKLHFTIHHGGDRSFALNGSRMKGHPLGIVTVRNARYVAVAIGDSHTNVQLVKI